MMLLAPIHSAAVRLPMVHEEPVEIDTAVMRLPNGRLHSTTEAALPA